MLRSTMRSGLFAMTLALPTGCGGAPDDAPDDAVRETESVVAPGAFYVIEAKHSGKALDVAGASVADGANVQQWTKNGSAAQQWRFEAVGGGYYVLRAKCSDKALDVANASTAEGANVQQWGYGGGPNQQWSLDDAGGGYYYVRARNSGLLLDVAWGSTADGANVAQVRQYAGSDAQKWKLTAVSGVSGAPLVAGEYTIQSAQTGKCLDVPGSSTADGAKLQEWSCNGTGAQRFRAVDLGGGAFEIVNTNSGKALDVTDVSLTAGARLSGELDIMEMVGFDPGQIHGTTHTQAYKTGRSARRRRRRPTSPTPRAPSTPTRPSGPPTASTSSSTATSTSRSPTSTRAPPSGPSISASTCC